MFYSYCLKFSSVSFDMQFFNIILLIFLSDEFLSPGKQSVCMLLVKIKITVNR